jgi:hypothetical protein
MSFDRFFKGLPVLIPLSIGLSVAAILLDHFLYGVVKVPVHIGSRLVDGQILWSYNFNLDSSSTIGVCIIPVVSGWWALWQTWEQADNSGKPELRRLVATLPIGLFFHYISLLALLLLAVPAVLLWTTLMPFIPVLLDGRRSVRSAFRMALSMTRWVRRPMFAIWLKSIFLTVVLLIFINMTLGAVIAGRRFDSILDLLIAILPFQTLFMLLAAWLGIVPVMVYRRLAVFEAEDELDVQAFD